MPKGDNLWEMEALPTWIRVGKRFVNLDNVTHVDDNPSLNGGVPNSVIFHFTGGSTLQLDCSMDVIGELLGFGKGSKPDER